MNKLVEKCINYFYITLIFGIISQLINIIIVSIQINIGFKSFATIFLSILNLILLISDMRHTFKQQFTEAKSETKAIRFTILPLLVFQVWLCLLKGFSGIVLVDYIMSAVIIEIVLNLKIKSIEYLETLANTFTEKQNSKEE